MRAEQLRTTKRIAIAFSLLFIVWLLFTFSLDPFSLLLGGAFSFVIALVTQDFFMEKNNDPGQRSFPRFEFFLTYIFVILWEIYLASFSVVYQVLTMRIDPGIIKIKTDLRSDFAKAFLANSITLTPGTVTVELQGNDLYVHWLTVETFDPEKAARIIKGRYETQLKRIFF